MDASTTPYKVVVVGSIGVGKTSVAERFRLGYFIQDPHPTVGSAYETVTVATPNGDVAMNVWDTAGQEKYRSLVPMYLKGADAVLVVFDVSHPFDVDSISELITHARSFADQSARVYIVGNKIDLISEDQVMNLRQVVLGLADDAIFVSAKTGVGINFFFETVAVKLSRCEHERHHKQVLRLEQRGGQDDKCC